MRPRHGVLDQDHAGGAPKASHHGLRAGVGPRILRVHAGAGRAGVSSGAGPISLYKGFGRPKRKGRATRTTISRQPTKTSVDVYQRQVRAAGRAEDLRHLADEWQDLFAMHLGEFPQAVHPVSLPPPPVDESSIRLGIERTAPGKHRDSVLLRQKKSEECSACSCERGDRACASLGRGAGVSAPVGARRVVGPPARERSRDSQVLDDAFEDNAVPSVPVDVEGSRVTVLIVLGSEDVIPETQLDRTPGGKLTSRRLTKTERADYYAAWMASNVLATVRETLAVAPALERVTVAALRQPTIPRQRSNAPRSCSPRPSPGNGSRLSTSRGRRPPCLTRCSSPRGPARAERAGRTNNLMPLDISSDEELSVLVGEVATALAHSEEQDSRRPCLRRRHRESCSACRRPGRGVLERSRGAVDRGSVSWPPSTHSSEPWNKPTHLSTVSHPSPSRLDGMHLAGTDSRSRRGGAAMRRFLVPALACAVGAVCVLGAEALATSTSQWRTP